MHARTSCALHGNQGLSSLEVDIRYNEHPRSVRSIVNWWPFLHPGARLLAVRGFLFLVLQELQAPSSRLRASCSQAGPSSSQVQKLRLLCDKHLLIGDLSLQVLDKVTELFMRQLTCVHCAQVSLSQCSSLSAAGSGASLLQELTGFLRRSLSHQAQVREGLYQVRSNAASLLCPRLPHHPHSVPSHTLQ